MGGANNCQSRSDQSDGQHYQDGVDFDRQTSFNPGEGIDFAGMCHTIDDVCNKLLLITM